MSKKSRHFARIEEYKERFCREPTDVLRVRLTVGRSLYKEAVIAIRQVIEERESAGESHTEQLDMDDVWRRIEAWLQTNLPEGLESLQAGASDEEIAAAEYFMEIRFPDDLRASLRIHNGNAEYEFGLVIPDHELLSLKRMQDEWKVWKDIVDEGGFEGLESEPAAGIRKDWWNVRWIPLTYDGGGDHHCLDMDPDEGGTKGQIITTLHDEPEREVVAASFRQWIGQYADDLESGRYAVNGDVIVNVDEL